MLFKIGLFLIPFENFFFAPSKGWAAIAPVGFFIYLLMKNRYIIKILKQEIKLVYFCIFFFFFGITNAFFHENINVRAILRTIYTFTLGISFYFSLIIRYKIENHNIKKDINILFLAYFISMLIGIFQWIVYKYKIYEIIEIIKLLSKRMYYPKIQFTFTEPSFVSLHLYGIVLILYLFFKKEVTNINRIHKVIMIIFPIINLFIGGSTRFLLDTFIIIIILFIGKFIFYRYFISVKIIICSILVMFLLFLFSENKIIEIIEKKEPRIIKIYEQGIYADGSLASRWFRINGSMKGYIQNPKEVIFGYGMGNISIPFLKGYNEAKEEYRNSYVVEVNELKNFEGHSLFCIYIKIISEYGIIMLLFLLTVLFSKKYLIEYLVILYIYIQYDSYAFYSIWLYIFFKNNYNLINKRRLK